MDTDPMETPSNFIKALIENDVREGKNDGLGVHLRQVLCRNEVARGEPYQHIRTGNGLGQSSALV